VRQRFSLHPTFEASGRSSVGDEVFLDAWRAATRESNMTNRLYVGNLAFDTTEDALRNAFAEYGEVVESKIVSDRESGRSRGFGFVEMATPEAAQQAISRMNGAQVDGRSLRVNEAEDRRPRSDGFSSRPSGGRGGASRRDRW
jgi:cold-inducible RNA-binding protein